MRHDADHFLRLLHALLDVLRGLDLLRLREGRGAGEAEPGAAGSERAEQRERGLRDLPELDLAATAVLRSKLRASRGKAAMLDRGSGYERMVARKI